MKLTDGQRGGMRLTDWNAHYRRLYGVTPRGDKAWSEEEVETLKRLYPDYRAAQEQIPWRTRNALGKKAARLGLNSTHRVWRDDQWSYARPLYRRGDDVREVIAPAVEKTPRQVWSKAARAKVRRPRRPPKDTPWPLVNAVRNRAFSQRLTMADLDHFAGTGGYFRSPRHFSPEAVQRAVRALGGKFVVSWLHA